MYIYIYIYMHAGHVTLPPSDHATGMDATGMPLAAVDLPDGPLGLDPRAELDAAHDLARDRLSRRPAPVRAQGAGHVTLP